VASSLAAIGLRRTSYRWPLSAAIAALRSTGRMVGQIAAVSITTAIIAQSAAPGQLQAKVFIVFAALLLACLPVIARVHEHRGPW